MTKREVGHVKTEAEVGVLQLKSRNSKDCQYLSKAEKGKEGFSSKK